MSNKQLLLNNVVLNISNNGATISVRLVIPVVLSGENKKKVKDKDTDLGTVNFSEKTSELIEQIGEAISKELLSKL